MGIWFQTCMDRGGVVGGSEGDAMNGVGSPGRHEFTPVLTRVYFRPSPLKYVPGVIRTFTFWFMCPSISSWLKTLLKSVSGGTKTLSFWCMSPNISS